MLSMHVIFNFYQPNSILKECAYWKPLLHCLWLHFILPMEPKICFAALPNFGYLVHSIHCDRLYDFVVYYSWMFGCDGWGYVTDTMHTVHKSASQSTTVTAIYTGLSVPCQLESILTSTLYSYTDSRWQLLSTASQCMCYRLNNSKTLLWFYQPPDITRGREYFHFLTVE